MATATRPRRATPSARGSARGAGEREQEYDLLTAALIGAVIGAGLSLLVHQFTGDDDGALTRVGRKADRAIDRSRRRARGDARRLGRAGRELRDLVHDEIERGIARAVGRGRKKFGFF